jgi:hypothetical protein
VRWPCVLTELPRLTMPKAEPSEFRVLLRRIPAPCAHLLDLAGTFE